MRVQTVAEQRIPYRRVALYAGTAVLFVVAGVFPVFVSFPYGRALQTLILFIVFSQIARMLVSALLAFAEPTPPESPAEADLPTVSVVVPAYEEANVLPDTIEACKALDYPKEKLDVVICYEAASTDATAEIAERAAADDSRFTAVERDEPGGGKAAATNYALEYATGEVIASIDADHQFATDAVRRAVRWFVADSDVWCVKGRCYGRNPTDSLVALYATVDRHITEKADLFAREVFGGFTIFGGGQAFFRRAVFEEIGPFDESVLVEDIDMSARIHGAGKQLRVDPGIISYEEQPTTLRALWSQRKRWARGWLQVSARYLGDVPRASQLSRLKRADAMYTFGYAILMPFLVVGIPLPVIGPIYEILLSVCSLPITAYVPYSRVLWTVMGAFPPLMAGCVFLQDRRDGLAHHPWEYLAALTLGAYLVANSVVYVVAFLEEFVYERPSVYVTTARADDGSE